MIESHGCDIDAMLVGLKVFLRSFVMGNCCRKNLNIGPISVVILGSEGAGKTELSQALCNEPRIDFTSTKGVRCYNVRSKCQQIKLTEIGGSDSVRGIWPHYFNDAFGVIFVIDCSLDAPFESMRHIFHQTMYDKHIRGKPLLIVANKQDLDQSIDVVDITYFFRIGEMCNLVGTPCLIITSGKDDRSDLKDGIDWLTENIIENYKNLNNRMKFNVMTPIKRFNGQRTSVPRQGKQSPHNRRIRSAPSTVAIRNVAIRTANGSPTKHLERLQHWKTGREMNLFRGSPIVVQHS